MSKAKDFFLHPLFAPIVDTIAGMGSFAGKPIAAFAETFRDGYNEDQGAEPSQRLKAGWNNLFGEEDGVFAIAIGGSVLAGIGGIIGGGFLTAAASTTGAAIATGVLGIPALLAVGVVAGPFLMLGVVTVVASALSVGFGGIAGFFKGCGRLLNHAISPKSHAASKTAEVFAEAEGIEQERPAVVFKNKREVFMAEAVKLSPKERQALMHDICETLEGVTVSNKVTATGGLAAGA